MNERFNVGSSYVMIVCNFQKLESEFRSEEGQHLFLFLTAILDLATKCSISKQLNNTSLVEKAVKNTKATEVTSDEPIKAPLLWVVNNNYSVCFWCINTKDTLKHFKSFLSL